MRAAVLRSIPGKLEIEDVSIDRPGPHEVLVRTAAAGLCHSDLHFMEGKYPCPVPAVLGHESAGVVEAVGDQVSYVQPGDHVITCLSVYCGACEHCLTGHLSLCDRREATQRPADGPQRISQEGNPMYHFFDLSSFAEQMLVHEHALVKISKDMPLDRAALIGCGVTTGLGAVFNTARVEPGTTVAVVGCGGIGLNCIQGAAIAGAARVIAVDMVPAKLELAKQFGATDLVDASGGDAVQQVQALSGGGVHYAFEAIGLKATAEQAFAMLRRGGTATVIGMIPLGETVEIPGYELLYEKRLQGSNMGSNRFRVDMPRYIDLYLQGRLELDALVSQRIALEDVNEGFAAMKSGEVARSVIVFD
ncbi:MAG: S-(hydroxymethyl)glutathione dehydrogenase / alcohol dehydrogenase [Acidimicrobiaceae bacterium]|jgi:S-(hydroxymethyl)glutathione dehydrogenase/alcohol dehydrogenase